MAKLQVYQKPCNQCLMTGARIVSAERAAEIIEDCRVSGNYFICHKASENEEDVCCRSFYNAQVSATVQIAQRLGAVEFVPLPTT